MVELEVEDAERFWSHQTPDTRPDHEGRQCGGIPEGQRESSIRVSVHHGEEDRSVHAGVLAALK